MTHQATPKIKLRCRIPFIFVVIDVYFVLITAEHSTEREICSLSGKFTKFITGVNNFFEFLDFVD